MKVLKNCYKEVIHTLMFLQVIQVLLLRIISEIYIIKYECNDRIREMYYGKDFTLELFLKKSK